MPQKLLEEFYEYIKLTRFWDLYFQMFQNFDHAAIEAKLNEIKYQMAPYDLAFFNKLKRGSVKNPLTNIFHTLFNIRLLIKNHRQPEDYGIQKKDIDMIQLKPLSQNFKKNNTKQGTRVFSEKFPSLIYDDQGNPLTTTREGTVHLDIRDSNRKSFNR